MQLRFKLRTNGGYPDEANGYLPDVDVFVRHIEVLTGRQIGLNFKNYIINSPDYAAIGAIPTVPLEFGNFGPPPNL